MAITQTIDIPADRRVFIDVPREIPTGKARVVIFPIGEDVQPLETEQPKETVLQKDSKTLGMTRKELDELLNNAHTPHSDALAGILSGMGYIDLDKIRMERLAKHL